ncbi:MAG: flagellar hook assembly protein FlgD, partial [Pseudomonadota bacterium]
LLTTQLQNQDPLEPLDTEQFTQQLVQFAGVEQSIQTNANLETLIELQSAVQRDEALGLVGRVVAVEGGETVLSPARNDRTTRFDYTVPANTRSVRLEIIDSQGEVISTLDAEQRAGRHAVVWPGTTSNGNTAADGTYRLRARAESAEGTQTELSVRTRSRINAVDLSSGAAQLAVAGRLIDPSAILEVSTEF